MKRILFVLMASLFAQMAAAQVYPENRSTTVNDFSNIIDAETEKRLDEVLAKLDRDTGIQFTVVTLSSVKFYGNDMTPAQYAEGLFNAWGVGSETLDNGYMLIVYRDDRNVQVKAGASYGTSWTQGAQKVVDDVMIPAFRQGNFSAGIETGTYALISDVVQPAPTDNSDTAPATGGGGFKIWWVFGILGALIGAGVTYSKAKLAKTPCDSCGKTGLTRERVTIEEATTTREGKAEVRLTCPHCHHVAVTPVVLAKLSDDKKKENSSQPFNGGSSSHGDAGGNW